MRHEIMSRRQQHSFPYGSNIAQESNLQDRSFQERLWGRNPIALLAALWVAFMLFLAVCDDAQARTAPQLSASRSQTHANRLRYYFSDWSSDRFSDRQIQSAAPAEVSGIGLLGESTASSASASLEGDVRLSESVSPARFRQNNPAACALTDGSILVAFEDERQGSKKIFLQKYTDAGVPVGGNILIAGRSDGFDLIEPALAATISNKVYLGYRDDAAGVIKVVRLNSDLSVDLAELTVSDNSSSVYAGPFALSARSNGAFAVAYESYSGGNTIALRRFDATGALLTAMDAVNSDGGAVSHWVPDLAYDGDGGLGVVWEDYRSGSADIYFRRFDSLGNPVSSEVNLIDSDAQATGQFLPSLAFSSIHGFLTGWSDTRSGWTVYLQRYSKQVGVGLVGANLAVSPLDSLKQYLDVDLATSPTGLLTATYCGYGATSDALAQRFDASLAPFGAPLTLTAEGVNQPLNPAAAISSNQALVWELRSYGDTDIRLTVTNSNLAPITVSPILVNDDQSGAVSDEPQVAVVNGESVVTAFRDLRRDGGDIYVQAARLDGVLSGSNRLVNEDNTGGIQSEPSIAANAQAYVVVWNDQRFISGISGARIYARYGAAGGGLTSDEILVSSATANDAIAPKSTPSVALAPNGSALISWIDTRNTAPQVFIRVLDSNHLAVGAEKQISDAGQGNGHTRPIASVDGNNIFAVSWMNVAATGGPVINVKRFSSSGSQLGSFVFSSDVPNVSIADFDADVDNPGKVFLLWQGTDNSGSQSLYLTVFSNSGAKIGATIEIPDNVNATANQPTLSVDEFGNVLMAWVDSRGPERRVYTQNFNADMTPAGGNQPLSLAAAPAMFAPSALAVRGRSWVSWVDARSEGANVYLRGFVHFPTDVTDDDNNTSLVPEQFALQQNYPNPFNPSTHIAFSLPQRAEVTVTIYNVLGQQIRTLAQGDYPAGEHQLFWDGRNNSGSTVSSGVYFYRLKTDAYTQTRKMTLLK